jgi:hypothetical protein
MRVLSASENGYVDRRFNLSVYIQNIHSLTVIAAVAKVKFEVLG